MGGEGETYSYERLGVMSTGDLSQSSAVCTSNSRLSRKLTWRLHAGLTFAFLPDTAWQRPLLAHEEGPAREDEEDGPGAEAEEHLRQLFIMLRNQRMWPR